MDSNLIDTYSKDYVVFDLETTGLSWEDDSIIEIAAIRVVDSKMFSSFSTLVNPRRHIPIEASSVNHIKDADVASAPTIDVAIKAFVDFIGDSILVGHNIHDFDMKFIQRDCERYLGYRIDNKYVDSVLLARKKLSYLSSRSLETLSKYYNVSYEGAHRALQDCGINHKVYEHLVHDEVDPEDMKGRPCKMCGGTMKLRIGSYGWFYGCSNYPECKYTERR